ncbi:hypothetical protein BJX68DRAFT_245302 [Aspergillus pseudodeflectus]|uniref:Uncharacterized protein n=1 Tax=Aspergillus pseudodeflectus TaxID=176178 RepID=A0ABR4JRE9_9EURO
MKRATAEKQENRGKRRAREVIRIDMNISKLGLPDGPEGNIVKSFLLFVHLSISYFTPVMLCGILLQFTKKTEDD